MATVGEGLKARIRIGGEIDPSWRGSVSKIKDSLAGMNRETKKLTSEQVKLAEKIKQGMKAGKNVRDLRHDYRRLTSQIEVATDKQNALNKALERAQRLERWKKTSGTMMRGSGRMLKNGALLGTAGLLGGSISAMFLASPMVRNAETAEKAGLARSYGVDYSTYSAWDSLGRQMGLNGENLGDLFEEYRNKVFDFKISDGKSGAVSEVFPELGIKAGEFAGKTNEEQVESLFEKLLQVKDEQLAAGMGDALFGGEANKILTYMRLTGKSYRELMNEQQRYNLVTKEGAAGAVVGNIAFSNFRTALSSGIDEIGGLLGEELAPKVNALADSLSQWYRGGGIESVKSFIRDDFIPGVAFFVRGLWTVGQVAFGLAKKLSWIVPDEKEDRRDVLKSLAMTGSVDIARSTAKKNEQSEWFEQQLRDNPDLPETIKKSYTDTRGFFRDDNETFYKTLDKFTGTPGEGPFSDDVVRGLQGMFDSPDRSPEPKEQSGAPYTGSRDNLSFNLPDPVSIPQATNPQDSLKGNLSFSLTDPFNSPLTRPEDNQAMQPVAPPFNLQDSLKGGALFSLAAPVDSPSTPSADNEPMQPVAPPFNLQDSLKGSALFSLAAPVDGQPTPPADSAPAQPVTPPASLQDSLKGNLVFNLASPAETPKTGATDSRVPANPLDKFFSIPGFPVPPAPSPASPPDPRVADGGIKAVARSLSALAYTPGTRGGIDARKTYQISARFDITQKEGEDGLQLAKRVNEGFNSIDFGDRASMTDTINVWSDK